MTRSTMRETHPIALQPTSVYTSNTPTLTATDVASVALCPRKLYLKYHGDSAAQGELPAMAQQLQLQGLQHEATMIDLSQFSAMPVASWAEGVEQTLAAMRAGVSQIYQGMVQSGSLSGQPDLLIRTEGKSVWGAYHYRPVDIKMGRSLRETQRRQMMVYLAILSELQGVELTGDIYLGTTRQEEIPFSAEDAAVWVAEAQQLRAGTVEPPPFINSVCRQCVWQTHCYQQAKQVDSLSLLPQLTPQVQMSLRGAGVNRLSDLAACEPTDLLSLKGIGPKTAPQLVNRARAFVKNEPVWFSEPHLPSGETELYLDVESIQHAEWGELETCYYWFGWVKRTPQEESYHYVVAEHIDEEMAMWEAVLAMLQETDGPIYHYSGYETQAFRKLAARYRTEAEIKPILKRCVDLLPLVRDNVALPLSSYSLKKVAGWLGYYWTSEAKDGMDSVMLYQYWLHSQEKHYLDAIRAYNYHDCEAMVVLRDWLHHP